MRIHFNIHTPCVKELFPRGISEKPVDDMKISLWYNKKIRHLPLGHVHSDLHADRRRAAAYCMCSAGNSMQASHRVTAFPK